MNWFSKIVSPDSGYVFKGPRGIPCKQQSQLESTNEKQIQSDAGTNFDDIPDLHHLSKLDAVRTLMRKNRVGIYLVMEHDEHQSEYVANRDRRIRFISNFGGSSAFVSIGLDWAELATDSRYYLIAERQLSKEWSVRKLGLPGVDSWQSAAIARAVKFGVDVGVDPRFINSDIARELTLALNKAGRKLVPIQPNLIDQVWKDQPALPDVKAFSQPISLSGESSESKVHRLRERMFEVGARSFVVYSLEEIAWLLNLRGGDIPYVPVIKAFAVVTAQSIHLFADIQKLSNIHFPRTKEFIVQIHKYDDFYSKAQYVARSPVWVPNGGTWGIENAVDGNFPNSLIKNFSPINLMRAIKNETEIKGIYSSQLKCSLSIVQYFAWLGEHIDEGLNEYQGGEVLLSFREKLPDFKGNSFETISAAGPNASAPHYSPTKTQSSPIRRDQVYLLDSGSHFLQGSTDITRTVHYGNPTPDEVKAYTLVMKGQLAVARCVFAEGTSGYKLDLLARQFLWEHGMDYGHGTGHGIGSYLNIHELPLGIGMSSGPESMLQPGHFVSDEPGYYQDNEFGVRLESDILVVEHFTNSAGRKFLTFDITTLVPYEPKLIDVSLLTSPEIDYINAYHERCYAVLRPLLKESYEISWLERCTKKLQ